jgi:hypothetical protein
MILLTTTMKHMLNKKIFMMKLLQIAELKGINPSENYTKSMYDLLSNDFINEEFANICDYILKNEELYGRMPEPRHFYKHKITKESKRVPELDAAVQWEFALSDNKKEINNLSNQILDSMGDDYGNWKWRMNSEHPKPTDQQWLRKEFIERYIARGGKFKQRK